jgi:hypothetical protein
MPNICFDKISIIQKEMYCRNQSTTNFFIKNSLAETVIVDVHHSTNPRWRNIFYLSSYIHMRSKWTRSMNKVAQQRPKTKGPCIFAVIRQQSQILQAS